MVVILKESYHTFFFIARKRSNLPVLEIPLWRRVKNEESEKGGNTVPVTYCK